MDRNSLSQGDFVWDGDRLTYVGGEYETRFGIDVSAYQNRASENNTIDWEAVAADGVDFAMVRVDCGGILPAVWPPTRFTPRTLTVRWLPESIPVSIFSPRPLPLRRRWRRQTTSSAFWKAMRSLARWPYDWEMHDSTYRVYGISPEVATACALAFCKRIEEAGYQPMIYTSQYVAYNKFNLPQLADYPIWYPEYKSASSEKLYPGFYYQMDIWQFSSSCTIDGIGGRVDANIRFLR